MFCAGCGSLIHNGCSVCPECGRPVDGQEAAAARARTDAYAITIRKLGLWFVLFALLNLGLGAGALIGGLATHAHVAGPFEPWPHPPLLEWTYVGSWAWLLLTLRVLLALLGGAALRVHAPWGRRLATFAAGVAVTQFPFGLLFGAYALLRFMGRQNAAMYAMITGGLGEPGRKLQSR